MTIVTATGRKAKGMKRGRRPSFIELIAPQLAESLRLWQRLNYMIEKAAMGGLGVPEKYLR